MRSLFFCGFFASIAVLALGSASEIATLKPLYRATPVARDGRPAALIVAPEGAEWRAAAESLAAGVRARCGATLELVAPESIVSEWWAIDFEAIAGRSLIALGNINCNRLIAVLWAEGYTAEDALYPGPGGRVVRTVHDPFGKGLNAAVLGVSAAADAPQAVEAFLSHCESSPQGTLLVPGPVADIRLGQARSPYAASEGGMKPPRLPWQEIRGAGEFEKALDAMLEANRLRSRSRDAAERDKRTLVNVVATLGDIAHSYFYSGDPGLPPLMKRVVDENRELLRIVPERVEMEAASADYMIWWDIAEELPVWTDQDRLDVTNAFLRDGLQGFERRSAHSLVKEGYVQVVEENHGTNSALHTYNIWSYFRKYYDLPETNYWMSVVEAIFAGGIASFQILEDSAGYLAFCPADSLEYAAKSRDMRYLSLGIARTHMEFIAQCSFNNLGLNSGFGDEKFLNIPWGWRVVGDLGWFLRDSRATWWWRHYLPNRCGLDVYQPGMVVDDSLPLEEPAEWTGMSVFPIYKQALGYERASKEIVTTPPEPAGKEWFNKIVFREAWDPEAQYLLFDGSIESAQKADSAYPPGPSGHNQNDSNTIINYTDEGRMWLVDHTYSNRAITEHSGLSIARDGVFSYERHKAKLREAAQGAGLALARSVFEDYSGADWERTIFWRQGDYFLVLDRVVAQAPGHFVARCSYRALGEEQLRGPALRLEQKGKHFAIVSDGAAELYVERFAFPVADAWKGYSFAKPVVKIFQQMKSASLEPGESLNFVNLLRSTAREAELDATSLIPLGSGDGALVRQGEDWTLAGHGNPPNDIADSAAYLIAPGRALFASASRIGRPGAALLETSAPAQICVSKDEGVWLEAEAPTRASIGAGERKRAFDLPAGRSALPDSDLAREILTLAEAAARGGDQEGQAKAAETAAARPQEAQTPQLPVRSVQLAETAAADMIAADLDGDGTDEWIVAAADGASAYTADGRRLWRFAECGLARRLDAADTDGDGRLEVAVGCENAKVYLLDSQGRERWSFECKPSDRALPPAVDAVRIADLEGDGSPEIVVGGNWLHCLDSSGQLKWEDYLVFSRGRIEGDFQCMWIEDYNRDGRLEIMAGYIYNYPVAIGYNAAGERVFPQNKVNMKHGGLRIESPLCVAMEDMYNRGARSEAFFGATGSMRGFWTGGPFEGYPGFEESGVFHALAACRPEQERPILCAASDMGAVLAFRAGGDFGEQYMGMERLWSCVIGRRIRAIHATRIADKDTLLAGTEDGTIVAIDARTGEIAARTAAGGSPVVRFLDSAGRTLALREDGLVQIVER